MTKYLKNKWIKALRSGDYKQTTCHLCDTALDKHCCLGVLCDISSKLPFEDGDVFFEDDRYDAEIPSEGLRLIGLKESEQTTLIIMNDSDHKTFEKIADWIKDNL